jgi:hypothetical protein
MSGVGSEYDDGRAFGLAAGTGKVYLPLIGLTGAANRGPKREFNGVRKQKEPCKIQSIAETMVLRKEYLNTARTLLRVARSMTDRVIADRLKMLASEYERGELNKPRDAQRAQILWRNQLD